MLKDPDVNLPSPLHRLSSRRQATSSRDTSRIEDESKPDVPAGGAAAANVAERRSQLPQFGARSGSHIGSLQRRTTDSSNNINPSAPVSRLVRPKSGVVPQLSSIPAKGVAKADGKDAMLPPPPPLGRSQSLRRPAISIKTQEGGCRVPISPLRQTPTNLDEDGRPKPTAQPATPNALHRSASSRIPGSATSTSQQPGSIRSLHSRTQSVTTVPSTQTTASRLTRSATITAAHARSKSSVIGEPVKSAQSSPTTGKAPPLSGQDALRKRSGTVGRDVSGSSTLFSARARPTFNTLQQHYSPAKQLAPRPPIPSSRSEPGVVQQTSAGGAASSFEMTKLQSELLYLSLLHQNADSTLRAYNRSAEEALRTKYTALQNEQAQSKETERLHRQTINTNALAEWAGYTGNGKTGLNQHFGELIRRLSSCLHELVGLSGTEGRYSRLVEDFSAWLPAMNEDAQSHGLHNANYAHQVFIDALPQDWHDSHASISQRLRLLERDIEGLPPLPECSSESGVAESALAKFLVVLTSMTKGMRTELDSMFEIQKMVREREAERVENAISKIQLGALRDGLVQAAAWHS